MLLTDSAVIQTESAQQRYQWTKDGGLGDLGVRGGGGGGVG